MGNPKKTLPSKTARNAPAAAANTAPAAKPSKAPAPSLSSPATRKAASKAADSILAAAPVPSKASKAVSDKPPPAAPPMKPAASGGSILSPEQIAALQAQGYKIKAPGEGRPGRKPRPRPDLHRLVSYLESKGKDNLTPGVILNDVPGLYESDGGTTYTAVVMTAVSAANYPQALIIGPTGEKGVKDRAKIAAAFAAQFPVTGADYLNVGPGDGPWITLEWDLRE